MTKIFMRLARVIALGAPLITTACSLSPKEACVVFGAINSVTTMNDKGFWNGCFYGAAAAYDAQKQARTPYVKRHIDHANVLAP